jgi:hypothetical protein
MGQGRSIIFHLILRYIVKIFMGIFKRCYGSGKIHKQGIALLSKASKKTRETRMRRALSKQD